MHFFYYLLFFFFSFILLSSETCHFHKYSFFVWILGVCYVHVKNSYILIRTLSPLYTEDLLFNTQRIVTFEDFFASKRYILTEKKKSQYVYTDAARASSNDRLSFDIWLKSMWNTYKVTEKKKKIINSYSYSFSLYVIHVIWNNKASI